MIELYDMGRTTHKAVPGMYEFIVGRADDYVDDNQLAGVLKEQARLRETGHSIPQELFSEMCRIWVEAYRNGDFPIDLEKLVFPDTISRFQRVKRSYGEIGILTSGSEELSQILYGLSIGKGIKLSDYVDEYFLGAEIGDKDKLETHANLWVGTRGRITALFDDKLSVCRAAREGFSSVGGYPQIYLVDRRGVYTEEVLEELAEKRIMRISSFDEVGD